MTSRRPICKLLAQSALVLLTAAETGSAPPTAFSYQGRMTVHGSPANGRYDLLFQVFDAETSGQSVGGTLGTNGVIVTAGQFAVMLDFGSAPFVGADRWLQIQISTNGAGNFTTLAPRQRLGPVPRAIYANSAGTVTNGAITTAQLAANAVTTANLQANAVKSDKIDSGQVVKSLNGLTDAVTLTQGANVTIDTVGNSLQISAPAGGLELPYSGTASSSSALLALVNSGNGAALKLTGNATAGFPFSVLQVDGGNANRGIYAYDVTGEAIVGDSWTGRGLFGYSGGGGIGVYGASHLFKGVMGVGDYGVWGESATGYGVHGQSTAPNGRGVSGLGDYGVFGRSESSGGRGVLGIATSNEGGAVGVKGSHQPSGNYGELGTSSAGILGSSAGGAAGVSAYSASGTACSARTDTGTALHGQGGGYHLAYLLQEGPTEPCRITMACSLGNTWSITTDNPGSSGQKSLRFNNGTDVVRFDRFGNVFAPAFNPSSDRNTKENFTEVNSQQVLEKVVALPITGWNFKDDKSIRHLGPMAQDFYAAFGLGTDDKHIATVDADGVMLAAIQGLNRKLEQSRAESAELRKMVESLKRLVDSMNQPPRGERERNSFH